MSGETAAPSWPVIGDRVATLHSDWRRNGHAPRYALVGRITRCYVYLDDGQRFSAATLERRNGSYADGVTKILPTGNVAVLEADARARHARLSRAANDAAHRWSLGLPGVSAADVILAFAPLTGVEAEIRALLDP